MDIQITRRDCRMASTFSRRGMNWQSACPLTLAYKRATGGQYKAVYHTSNKRIVIDGGYKKEFFMTKKENTIIKEMDDFIKANGWGRAPMGQKLFNADALYTYLAEKDLLTFEVREAALV